MHVVNSSTRKNDFSFIQEQKTVPAEMEFTFPKLLGLEERALYLQV